MTSYKVLFDGKLRNFYPLVNNAVFEEIDKRSLEEWSDIFRAKIATGVCGFNVVWTYDNINKKDVKIVQE
jgi:hypothetical protein